MLDWHNPVLLSPLPLRPPDLAKLVRAAIYSREPGRIIFDVPVGFGCIAGAGSTPKVKLPPLAREVVGTLLKLRLRRHQPRGFILVALKVVPKQRPDHDGNSENSDKTTTTSL